MASKRKDQSAVSGAEQFFLYSKLNENETKNLKKASTNKEEKKILAQIFNLKVQANAPNQQINKLDLLLLDFHYINYEFCKENQYSNEKTSTLLSIFDFLLHYILDRQFLPEEGFKLLKRILEKHSIQRPPFQILIFDPAKDVPQILQFSLKTLFRHYSLYEFSFKPRMELVLKCEPFLNRETNAELSKLQEMTQVETEEAEKLKVYLGIYNQQLGEASNGQEPDLGGYLKQGNVSDLLDQNQQQEEEQQQEEQQEEENQEEQIDWKKVGKIYKGDEKIEAVLEREMARMKKVLEQKIGVQDIELEEKVLQSKGKKK